MLPPIAPMLDPKGVLRERMKGERREIAKKRPDAAQHAARNFVRAINHATDDVIALYYPIKNELDTEPLAMALVEMQVTIALPVVATKKQPLIFRRYSPGDTLINGAYGAKTPDDTAAIVTPAIIVTPLLGFTRQGGRLGYGGGYYDRTLAELRHSGALNAVGYAFGAQQVDALPLGRLDQPLDWVVTEREAIRCS